MRYPSIDKLLKIVDSKYKLVLLSSKRAKSIEQGSPVQLEKHACAKPVGIALEEMLEDKLNIKY